MPISKKKQHAGALWSALTAFLCYKKGRNDTGLISLEDLSSLGEF